MRMIFKRISHAFLGRTILEEVDLEVAKGEIVALVGPSGCGKTTLLQIAAGLIDPLKGEVKRLYQRHAMVFQEPRLLPWLTARNNIAYGLASLNFPRNQRLDIAVTRAREVGLDTADLDKYPAELSGGMRQRVAVARALAVQPDIIFFDEPFTAIDAGLKRALQDLVVQMAEGKEFSGLFVTHDLAEAVRIADRLAVLSSRQKGIVDIRTIPGKRTMRDNRTIFEIVETWTQEPLFAELLDGEGRQQA